MALGMLICYTFIMSMYFIGSTHSCDTLGLKACLTVPSNPFRSTNISTAEICSRYNSCFNSVHCTLDTIPSPFDKEVAPYAALCDDGIFKACDTVARNNCRRLMEVLITQESLIDEQMAELCSIYNHCRDCVNSGDSMHDDIPASVRVIYDTFGNSCRGLTLSACDTVALTNCNLLLTQYTGNPTPEEACSKYNRYINCLNSADCMPDINPEILEQADTVCKGLTHSECDTVALTKCSSTIDLRDFLTEDTDNPTPEETSKKCSEYHRWKGCLNSANCLTLASSQPSFAKVDSSCKDWNGVSTLTPRLTFIMAIMFVVLIFTRMMT